MIGVEPHGNAAPDCFTNGANPREVFITSRADLDLQCLHAVLNVLFGNGCHFIGRVNADGAVGVQDLLCSAEQGIQWKFRMFGKQVIEREVIRTANGGVLEHVLFKFAQACVNLQRIFANEQLRIQFG